MVVEKGKKSKVEENDTDLIDSELFLSFEKLQEIQDELEKVNEEASDKVLEVEQKYNELRRPAYVKRNDIIKTIPDFWLTAFMSHPALSEILTEEDQKIFKYLDSLDVEDFKDVKLGYSIAFNFKKNPYFEDSKLTKTYSFYDEGVAKITGTSIKWKEGMGSSNGVIHEKKGKKRPLPNESFLTWLGETELKGIAEFADEIAEIIKEDVWSDPLKFFNNESDEEDSDGDDDDDDDENEENDEEADALDS